ncbi:uncharacterized protein [Oryza sativa Japonica Group]|uniref:uncharacterized protein isoform X3 n=1 Tax=Oryza sativa subsp. japonica TaxID=39947 RepID=UPI00077548E0|nr:uncharacterized protein LOC4328122 isoform X3 [Oryza sativa Japonica Group]KAF2942727.1 hypothetical protein DAI22_02g017200 [Oryza sativa Japonica Group]KAF2942728.1 hypothetical protein DAI22_02g017200 [Oryza sativa Japonica Group]
MVDMEKKREKLVAGLTRRHMIRSGSSSSSSPTAAAAAADNNKNMSEGGDLNLISRQKKGKAKVLKWRLSNTDMDMKGEEGGSDGDYDDTVLSSLTTASFSSLISRKRVKSLGKVAEDCDAIDPPVPRKLRSAINKRASQTVSTSPRHVKKRRHLSAISSQTFLMDRETRCNAIPQLANHFSKEEEVVVDALLSLSQIPHLCELSSDRGMAEDNLDLNVTSVSYSAGATKVDEKISALPTAGTEVANQPALDEPVERTGNVSQINHVPCGGTCNNTNPTLSNDGQIHDISLGIVTNLPSPSKDYNNSRKQLKVQFDNSTIHPTKIEAPRCLENSKKPDILEHDRKNVKNNTAQEIVPPVQTSKPCASHRPSSNTLASCNNTAAETVKGTGEHENLSLVNKNGTPSKTWKRSITHVYMCHLIQMHLDKEKASQNRVKPEEVCHSHISRSPDGSTISKNGAQDEKFYALHFDVRLPVQPSCSVCDTTIARQKMVSGNFLNLPTSAALSGVQHVQYLHPPIAPRGAMPYPIQHLPYTRGNLTHTALLLQQMPQYMCNPNPAIMKIQQQLMPNQHQHQQQQQMWQFQFPQYHHPRPDAAAAAVSAAWQHSSRLHDVSSLRPVAVLPAPPPPPPPQMELFCSPYHGGSRQPPQLRLI